MRTADIINQESQYILQTYPRPEFVLERGNGVYLFDMEGNRYLDAASGVGASILGHAVPEIVEAIRAQAATLAFAYGGLVDNDQRQKLAAQLQELEQARADEAGKV